MLRSVEETLAKAGLDVARDRRIMLLEVLIVVELGSEIQRRA